MCREMNDLLFFFEFRRCNFRDFPESDDIEYTLCFTMYTRGPEVQKSIENQRKSVENVSREKNAKPERVCCHCFVKMTPKRRPRRPLGCQSTLFWDPECPPKSPQGPPKGSGLKKISTRAAPRRSKDAPRRPKHTLRDDK